jgi:hypothetical protein
MMFLLQPDDMGLGGGIQAVYRPRERPIRRTVQG